MEIKEIGKEGLLERLRKPFVERSEPLRTTIGGPHKAAVIGKEGLSSSVLLMEGVDFDLVYFPLGYLGFKAVTSAVSGLYGDGGKAAGLSIVLAISQRFQVEDVEFFMKGVREACAFYGTELRFLDITSSLTGFAISVTAFGERGAVVTGSPKANELLCVTGDLGAAYMGLQLMVREKGAFDSTIDFQPDFGGREYILERQLKPALPVALLGQIKALELPLSSLTVLKEGLTNSLVRISQEAGIGVRIYEKAVPIDFQTARMAEDFGLDPSFAAMHGGEDFQFLFTVPVTEKEKVDALEGVTAIGFTTEASEGLTLVGRSGGATPIRPDDLTTAND